MTYESCSYFVPSSLPASQTRVRRAAQARKRAMLKPRFTYQDLLERQDYLVTTKQLNSQTAANRATALRAFLSVNKCSVDDPVGDEMRVRWAESLETYVNSLTALGRTSRAISNSKAAVRPWREMVVEADSLRALDDEKPTPFQVQLKALMGTFAIKHVANTTRVPYDMLLGWVNGKKPRQSNAKFIFRLEGFFGIQRGELARLASITGAAPSTPLAQPLPAIEYRATLAERTRHQFWLRPPLDSPLRQQWKDFVSYKVAAVPLLERSSKGTWRISPLPLGRKTNCEWFRYHGSEEVPSAGAAWAKVGGYLGWLALPEDQGGMGMPVEELQTMAWLIDPELIQRHVEWRRKRAGGKLNGFIPDLLGWIQSLVRPDVGYFWQCPWLQQTLPERYRLERWQDMCNKLMRFCARYTQSLKGQVEVSRDPFEPMAHIVDLDEPLEAVVDMTQRMRAARPIGNPVAEAVWSRDLLLIKLLVSNPLRVRQFSHLTWRADNTGNLYQKTDGSWWISYRSRFFKNSRGAAGDLDYDSPVQENVWGDIERYLFRHRATLMVAPTDLVFLASKAGPGQKRTSHVPWRDLSRRVEELTRRHLWRCPGIGGHAMRGLTGTAIIKAAPGEIETVAKVLNDRPLTVQRHYARFTSGDGAKRMGDLLKKSFRRM